jgi:hypothetical protein
MTDKEAVSGLDLDAVEAHVKTQMLPGSTLVYAVGDKVLQLIAAARELERIRQQLALIKARGGCGSDVMTPARIEAWATELGWKPEKDAG